MTREGPAANDEPADLDERVEHAIANVRLGMPQPPSSPIQGSARNPGRFGLAMMILAVFVLVISAIIFPTDRRQGVFWFVYAWLLLFIGARFVDRANRTDTDDGSGE